MQNCEMCGKKIRDYKMFSPKGLLDMIYVCEECHKYGRDAESGSVAAVNYFTKQIDINNATDAGRKCIDRCLTNAKEAIEGKLESKNNQQNVSSNNSDRPMTEEEILDAITITTTDSIVGMEHYIYLPVVMMQDQVQCSQQMNVVDCISRLTTELKRMVHNMNGMANAILGFRVNTMVDPSGNIAIVIYGTPVVALDAYDFTITKNTED